jgi:hypothetical protein
LREVAAEAAEQNHRSPRVSKEWSNGEVQQLQQYGDDELAAGVTSKLNGSNLQQQDDLAVAQNGGMTGSTTEDAEMADAEGDDGMDDDMMDKISSSPSIDDGGYSLPPLWPQRSTSLAPTPPKKSRSFLQACVESSSSPFVETPDHFPMPPRLLPIDKGMAQGSLATNDHHLLGKYLDDALADTKFSNLAQYADPFITTDSPPDYEQEFSLTYYSEGPQDKPLNLPGQEHDLGYMSDDLRDDNIDNHQSEDEEESGSVIHHEDGLMIPYEESGGEDDDYEIPYLTDSRFVDSGWGGECLQFAEDIDFEFVYALHTFVATVEGQANATKGDTMVLLDDSNSYWWLVRVVKDSSIGE